ncbi:hypothetical protein HPB51_001712 [Rhipicephalus microplus]|uniref:PHD-type domain-containing protein n=1 Tax=Rhipicephalus microplus TaxID=6941 RepID=A0A9J6DER0_RHIMP|nr:hypothetical protein HPB51_001712 [Rhipicephalus microplus]
MKQGCPATVVIAARRTSQQLEITKIDCDHNLEVNKEIFQLYPENRRLTHHEKEYVLPLLDLNVLPNVIAGKLAEKTVILTGIAGQEAAARVLNEGGILDESDIEVRPEELASALLDHRVSLPKLKKYFTAKAWLLLSSSLAVKKKGDIWSCAQCKKKDDGEIKMVLCDQCLEWFHWPCASVKKEDLKRHWFCMKCCSHT